MPLQSSKNKEVQRFLNHVTRECEKHDVKLDIRAADYIWCDKIRVSGYFDGDERVLAVAEKNKMSLYILVHEYAHMTQWLDQNSIWYANKTDHIRFDEWLAGKEVPEIHQIINEVRDLELDNEKRSVKLIKRFKLPIDVNHYRRQANSYLFFYEHIKNTRKWCKPHNRPYNNKKVVAVCPTRFLPNYETYFKKVQHIYEMEEI